MSIEDSDCDVELPFNFEDDELRGVNSLEEVSKRNDITRIIPGFIASIHVHVSHFLRFRLTTIR